MQCVSEWVTSAFLAEDTARAHTRKPDKERKKKRHRKNIPQTTTTKWKRARVTERTEKDTTQPEMKREEKEEKKMYGRKT